MISFTNDFPCLLSVDYYGMVRIDYTFQYDLNSISHCMYSSYETFSSAIKDRGVIMLP